MARQKKEYVYIVVKLGGEVPEIVCVYRNVNDANQEYGKHDGWINVIQKEVK